MRRSFLRQRAVFHGCLELSWAQSRHTCVTLRWKGRSFLHVFFAFFLWIQQLVDCCVVSGKDLIRSGEVWFPAGRWSEKRRRQQAGLPVPRLCSEGVGGATPCVGTLGLSVCWDSDVKRCYLHSIHRMQPPRAPSPPPSFAFGKMKHYLYMETLNEEKNSKTVNVRDV